MRKSGETRTPAKHLAFNLLAFQPYARGQKISTLFQPFRNRLPNQQSTAYKTSNSQYLLSCVFHGFQLNIFGRAGVAVLNEAQLRNTASKHSTLIKEAIFIKLSAHLFFVKLTNEKSKSLQFKS